MNALGLKARVQELFGAVAPPVGSWVVTLSPPKAIGRVTKVEPAFGPETYLELVYTITVDFGSSVGVFATSFNRPKFRPADVVEVIANAKGEV